MVFLAVLFVDQLTKYIVIQALPLGRSWPPGDGFFQITHVANTGSAFGLFSGQNFVLTFASLIGIGVLVLFYRSHPDPGVLVRLSLGLMLAGATGNLLDRIFVGWVTDFIDIGPWYIFNVADSAIVTGVVLLGASILLQKPSDDAAPAHDAAGTVHDLAGDASSSTTDSTEQAAAPPEAEAHDAGGR